jgi:hypothetical protein
MRGFGPPVRVTAPSACPYLDHSVSGLIQRTFRPIKTRFRYAYTYRLKLARQIKSLTHYTKGTPSPRTNLGLRLIVGIRFQELFHSPCRGTFHLSLTVLVHYRSHTST